MTEGDQSDLLSPSSDLRLAQLLIADLHDDLIGKIARHPNGFRFQIPYRDVLRKMYRDVLRKM